MCLRSWPNSVGLSLKCLLLISASLCHWHNWPDSSNHAMTCPDLESALPPVSFHWRRNGTSASDWKKESPLHSELSNPTFYISPHSTPRFLFVVVFPLNFSRSLCWSEITHKEEIERRAIYNWNTHSIRHLSIHIFIILQPTSFLLSTLSFPLSVLFRFWAPNVPHLEFHHMHVRSFHQRFRKGKKKDETIEWSSESESLFSSFKVDETREKNYQVM